MVPLTRSRALQLIPRPRWFTPAIQRAVEQFIGKFAHSVAARRSLSHSPCNPKPATVHSLHRAAVASNWRE
jgi:hypothetical protein